MTQEDKDLLLKDLSGRLPYKVICKVKYQDKNVHIECTGDMLLTCVKSETPMLSFKTNWYGNPTTTVMLDKVNPYLRPMSSMTKDEKEEYNSHITGIQSGIDAANLMIWIYQHHLDVFHLIEKGLALEASEDMYKTK